METIKLTDGGNLLLDQAFLPSELADACFTELRDQCAWVQKPGVFGHMQPRLVVSYDFDNVPKRNTTGRELGVTTCRA